MGRPKMFDGRVHRTSAGPCSPTRVLCRSRSTGWTFLTPTRGSTSSRNRPTALRTRVPEGGRRKKTGPSAPGTTFGGAVLCQRLAYNLSSLSSFINLSGELEVMINFPLQLAKEVK